MSGLNINTMGPIKLWLEGVSEKPSWVGDDDVGAAVHVDKKMKDRLLTLFRGCFKTSPVAK